MKSRSQQLRAAVRELLIPFIYTCGFEDDTRDIHRCAPYGHQTRHFLRRNGDVLELVEIQFDKHGLARFVFNFGVVPPQGVDDYLGHHPQDETAICNIPRHARLYAGNPYLMRWYGFPRLKIPVLRNPSAEDIVRQAIKRFPQIEAWLREDVKGPNVRIQMGIGATGISATIGSRAVRPLSQRCGE